MSLMTISSSNPNFSHILAKNPNTIAESGRPYQKAIRRGYAYGWYMTEGSFRLWFKDNPHEVSYPTDADNPEFEYLDRNRYAHPFLMNSLVSECLSTAVKTRHELDTDSPFSCTLETTVEIRSKTIGDHLARMYSNQEEGRVLSLMCLGGRAFIIRIQGNSVYEVLNTAIIASILICTADPTIYVDLRNTGIDKYARSLNGSNAPYFIRYLFNRNAFSNMETFKKNKHQLNTPTMDFAFGDTHRQRMDFVFPALKNGTKANVLHEIGTGEGRYTTTLVQKYEKVIGWEPEEELREKVVGKLTSRGISENFEMREGLTSDIVVEKRDEFEGVDIVVTEVFEHIEKDDATKLLISLMQTKFARMVVTVPNITFNQLYKLDQPFRHDDHKWEPTREEFETWVKTALEAACLFEYDDVYLMFHDIGDKVTMEDGSVQTPSLGFVLVNKNMISE